MNIIKCKFYVKVCIITLLKLTISIKILKVIMQKRREKEMLKLIKNFTKKVCVSTKNTLQAQIHMLKYLAV